MSIEIRLDNFAGPLDLLLHLIKSNEMDIYDIRIVEITEQYLAVIDQMKQLDLDIAGEFLLMAATLMHIKSRMLLPVSEEIGEEEEDDPRAELVKRLLEYQRYKEVAESFRQLPWLERDVFTRGFSPSAAESPENEEDARITAGVYQLAEAFHRLVKKRPVEVFHEVIRETFSVADFIERILDQLSRHDRRSFKSFFAAGYSRDELIVTFLAMLELVKMRLINVDQVDEFSDLWLKLAVPVEQLPDNLSVKAVYGYE